MERLTEKHFNGNGYYMVCSGNCANDDEMCGGCPENEKIIDRLGAYEDTGMNPEQIPMWIPVTERLPEEHDSFFTSFYGTAKWQDGMFLKCSDTVLASVEYEDGKRRVKAIITKDGKWDFSKMYRASKVTHWMPLPEPPKGE